MSTVVKKLTRVNTGVNGVIVDLNENENGSTYLYISIPVAGGETYINIPKDGIKDFQYAINEAINMYLQNLS